MYKTAITFLSGVLLSVAAFNANAITLSVDPSLQAVEVSDSVSVDVVISELGNFAAPSLGAFDVDVTFDASLLTPTAVTFGTELDLFGFGINPRGVSLGDPIDVFEISLDSASDLNSLQPGTFTLFSITFSADAAGTSSIDFGTILLADAAGNAFGDPTTVGGEITIRSPQGAVPAASPLVLLLSGLCGLVLHRRVRPQVA